jgi:hypothetical protein
MKLESKMKKLAAALVAAGALVALSGCVDPYYGGSYYGGGSYGNRNGGSSYGYYGYNQPYGGYGYRGGYGYGNGNGDNYSRPGPYRNRNYDRRYYDDRRY